MTHDELMGVTDHLKEEEKRKPVDHNIEIHAELKIKKKMEERLQKLVEQKIAEAQNNKKIPLFLDDLINDQIGHYMGKKVLPPPINVQKFKANKKADNRAKNKAAKKSRKKNR